MVNVLPASYKENEGTVDWAVTSGSATLTNSTDYAQAGTKSLKAVASNAFPFKVSVSYANRVACSGSTTYTTVWYARSSVARWLSASIDWYDSGGGYISTFVLDDAGNTSTSAFVSKTDTSVSPSGAASFTIGFDWDNNATSSALYLDEITVSDPSSGVSFNQGQMMAFMPGF